MAGLRRERSGIVLAEGQAVNRIDQPQQCPPGSHRARHRASCPAPD